MVQPSGRQQRNDVQLRIVAGNDVIAARQLRQGDVDKGAVTA